MTPFLRIPTQPQAGNVGESHSVAKFLWICVNYKMLSFKRPGLPGKSTNCLHHCTPASLDQMKIWDVNMQSKQRFMNPPLHLILSLSTSWTWQVHQIFQPIPISNCLILTVVADWPHWYSPNWNLEHDPRIVRLAKCSRSRDSRVVPDDAWRRGAAASIRVLNSSSKNFLLAGRS